MYSTTSSEEPAAASVSRHDRLRRMGNRWPEICVVVARTPSTHIGRVLGVKAVLALGIITALGFLGFQVADPLYDAAARTICSNHAEDEGLVLVEARGTPTGRFGFSSFPDYSCRFRDSAGSAVFVDENDRLIEPTWTYRALRAAGWLAWVVGIVAGVGISAAFGLMKRD
jgi:hypothetical protein